MASQPQNVNPIRPVEEIPQLPSEPLDPRSPLRPGIDQLREILTNVRALLLRRRRVFALVAGSLAALLSLAILLQTPQYEATTVLLVKFGRELVYQSEVGSEQTLTARGKETMINSEIAILRSRPVLHDVVRAVGIGTLYPDLGEPGVSAGPPSAESAATEPPAAEPAAESSETEDATAMLLYAQAAERLGESIAAQALPETDVLTISFQHPDPIAAESTVRQLVGRFIEAHLEAYGDREIATFLDQRVGQYEKRLDAAEKRLQEFETEHAAFALESPQTTLMQWRDETLRELSEIENRIAAIRMRHQDDVSVAEARNTLMQLQLEAEQLEGNLLRDTSNRIEVVQRFIAGRKQEVEREVRVFEEKRQSLQRRLAQTELELREFPALSGEYRALRRERDAEEEQYSTYNRRLRDARLSSEMDREKITSISIIQPASTGPGPVWPPSKTASLPLAFVLALVAGGLVAVVVDRMGGTGIPWLDEGAGPV